MTTLTSGANGATNNFDSSQLIGLSTASLGTHSTTTFTLTVDVFTVVGQGTGFTYGGGHPGGGTLTSLSIDTNGTPASWGGFSISVAPLWQALAAGDTTTFDNLFFSGNDTFDMHASQSPDFLSGYGGNDSFSYGDYFSEVTNIDGGPGADTLNLNGDYGFRGLGNIANVETISLGGGHDYDLAMSPASAVTVNGSALGVGDILKFDGVWSGAGSLLVTGGSGSDTFVSGHGNDTFNGGPGTDTVDYSRATSGVTVNLSVVTAQGVGGGAGSDTLLAVENIIGSTSDDTLTGNASDNVLIGGDGHDVLDGGAGNDTASFQDVQLLSGAHGITVDMRVGGNVGNDTLISIESVIGSQLGDLFIGNAENNVFDAGGCANAAYDTVTYQYATGGVTFNMIGHDSNGATIVAAGGGQGTDTLIDFTKIVGTDYNDTFYLQPDGAHPFFDGGAGVDTVSLEKFDHAGETQGGELVSVENVIGSAFNDNLGAGSVLTTGGAGDDTIGGGIGDNLVYGDDGNDTIVGYSGSDTIYGGAGDDVIYGGAGFLEYDGDDKIFGGDGNDTIYAGGLNGGSNTGNVLFDGGAGDDAFFGAKGQNGNNHGSSTVTYQSATGGVVVDLSNIQAQEVGGGQGQDTLFNIDNLVGSEFGDVLTARASDNVLTGGAGDDLLNLYGPHDQGFTAGQDKADGGSGIDTASYSNAWTGVTVSLAIATAQNVGGGGGALDTLVSIESLIGSAYDDILSGSDFANVVTTLSGNDAVNALGGNDTIQLDNWLTTADKVDGGSGQDTLNLVGDYAAGVTFAATTAVNVEKIVVGAGFDYQLSTHDATVASGQFLTVDAGALGTGNRLIFNGAAETNGVFILKGGAGNDALTGGSGNDYFYPGVGADAVTGGSGNDAIVFTTGFDASDKLDGTAGTDTLFLTADYTAGVTFTATTLVNVEKVILGAGFDYQLTTHDATVAAGQFLTVDPSALAAGNKLVFDGSAETDGAFVLKGGAGNDALTGGFGNDYYYPGLGADAVIGGNGNDAIIFTAGFDANDELDGAAGTDTLYLTADYAAGVTFTATTLVNVEKVILGAGFDYRLTTHDATVAVGHFLTVDASALGAANKLIFNGSAEVDGSLIVKGGAGNDDITAGSGDDTIVAGAADDLIHPGSGNDTVLGGDGNDYLSFGKYLTALDRIDGGAGTGDEVVLQGNYATPLVLSATTMTNVEYLVVRAGSDYAFTTHNATVAASQTFNVNASALGAGNTLVFNGSAETDGHFVIVGGAGRDRLKGGTGADTLTGSGGVDKLTGGLGADRLEGDGGADKFVYFSAAESSSDHYDTLVGFDFTSDKIDAAHRVKAIDATIATGTLDIGNIDADLSLAADAVHFGKYHAVLFTPTVGGLAGQMFLIVDANGVAGYQAGLDLVFHLEAAVNLASLDTTDIV